MLPEKYCVYFRAWWQGGRVDKVSSHSRSYEILHREICSKIDENSMIDRQNRWTPAAALAEMPSASHSPSLLVYFGHTQASYLECNVFYVDINIFELNVYCSGMNIISIFTSIFILWKRFYVSKIKYVNRVRPHIASGYNSIDNRKR